MTRRRRRNKRRRHDMPPAATMTDAERSAGIAAVLAQYGTPTSNGHTAMPATHALFRVTSASSHETWLEIMHRLTVTCRDYAPDTPPEALLQFVREWATKCPQLLGLWGWRPEPEVPIQGHLLAWVDAQWGQPYIYVHQIQADRAVPHDVRQAMIRALQHWAHELNADLTATGTVDVTVDRLRFLTSNRTAKQWAAYLGLSLIREQTLCTFALNHEENG